MGLLLGFAVLSFFITAGADVPTDIRPNVIYYNTGNTTQGSVFQKNVVSSLDLLIKQTPLNGSADYKIGNGSDIVWSHGECYYNFSKESCSTCLGSIRDTIKQAAPLSVGAQKWINTTDQSCYLHYENYNFTQASPSPPAPPGIDVGPNIAYFNSRNAQEGSTFFKNRDRVLGYLLANTPPNGSANYSYGDYPDKVWGHAQCYNMSNGCNNCLQDARDRLQQAAPLSVGGTIWLNTVSDRCYLRYENYRIFADVPAAAPAPHGSPGVSLSSGGRSKTKIIVGVTVGGASLLALCTGIFLLYLQKRSRQELNERHRFLLDAELEKSYEGPLVFTLDELRAATKNFSDENKLGEGGFGAVYKAMMKDGTQVAVKRLSGQSQQGRQEFGNEIHIISNIQHRNLVRLKGYCVQGNQKLLVYEFLENGSLDCALFSADPGLNLDWPARLNIAIGVARGLAYLHEESQIVIIHRDIKASNILLDRNLNPKISDFGISKLFDMEKGYTSTMIAGTLGYLAPEYALRGRLTAKVDVYSFGVLLLEIISGRKCNDPTLPSDEQLLLQWTWSLKKSGRLHEVVDKRLRTSEDLEAEFLRVIQVALVCTHDDEELRPVMSNVVTMLLGHVEVPPTQTQAPDYFAQIVPLQSSSPASSLQESITNLEAR